MELKLTTQTGRASTKSVELSDANFGIDFNEALIHQVVTAYQAGARSGTKAQKNRAAVSGGGAKPWRQRVLVVLVRELSAAQSGAAVV